MQEGGLAGLGEGVVKGRTRRENKQGGLGGRTCLWRCDQLCHYLSLSLCREQDHEGDQGLVGAAVDHAAPHPSALGELPCFLEDRGGEENPGWLPCR